MNAHSVVAKAVRDGLLAKLDGTVACVDCGESAAAYDHRDYSKPLDVEPVCDSCNVRRGSAVGPRPGAGSPRPLTLRLDAVTVKCADQLMRDLGLTRSDVVRLALRVLARKRGVIV